MGTCPIFHTQPEGVKAHSTSLHTARGHTDPGSAALVLSGLEPQVHPYAGMGIIFFSGRVERPALLSHAQTGTEQCSCSEDQAMHPLEAGLIQPHSPLLSRALRVTMLPASLLMGTECMDTQALEAAPGAVLAPRGTTLARARAEQPLPET